MPKCPRHFYTGAEVSSDTSAPVPKCLVPFVLVPKCSDFSSICLKTLRHQCRSVSSKLSWCRSVPFFCTSAEVSWTVFFCAEVSWDTSAPVPKCLVRVRSVLWPKCLVAEVSGNRDRQADRFTITKTALCITSRGKNARNTQCHWLSLAWSVNVMTTVEMSECADL